MCQGKTVISIDGNLFLRENNILLFNPHMYRGGWGWMPPPFPHKVLEFLPRGGIKHQHLTFSVAVRSSLQHILRQVQ